MTAEPNGCHNRQLRAKVLVQDGWFIDGVSRTPKLTMIPDTMSKDCQYTHSALGQKDPGCTGCRHRAQPQA